MNEKWNQLKLLLWKNWLQKKRSFKSTIAETIIPFIILYFIKLICEYSKDTIQTNSMEENLNIHTNEILPTLYLLPLLLKKTNLYIAIINNELNTNFLSIIDTIYPGSNYLNIPKLSNYSLLFNNENEFINYYLQNNNKHKSIYATIILNKNKKNNKWKSILRFNNSIIKDMDNIDEDTNNLMNNVLTRKLMNNFNINNNRIQHGTNFYHPIIINKKKYYLPGTIPFQVLVQEYINYNNNKNYYMNHNNTVNNNDTLNICEKLDSLIYYANIQWNDFEIIKNKKSCIDIVSNNNALYNDIQGFLTSNHPNIDIYVQKFPIPNKDETKNPIEDSVGAYFIYLWSFSLARFVRTLVKEKELKIKQGMIIMGLDINIYYYSWFLTYQMICFFINIMGCILFNGILFPLNDIFSFFNFLLLSIIFSISILSFGFITSTFFSRSNTAVAVAPLLLFILSGPSIAKIISKNMNSTPFIVMVIEKLSIFSATDNFMNVIKKILVNISKVNDKLPITLFSTSGVHIMPDILLLIFNIVLYFIFGIYLDLIIPKEYGITFPWYFIFQLSYWKGFFNFNSKDNESDNKDAEKNDLLGDNDDNIDQIENPQQNQNYVEELSIEQISQYQNNKCIHIKNLTKIYSDGKLAVNKLNLKIFENEIFGLLGTNGAGKTTTISILSGLIPLTTGSIKVYGHNIYSKNNNDKKQIQKIIGICPQHDVLFENMTVEEHLIFFAALKGIYYQRNSSKLNEIMSEIGITEKRNVYAFLLSGGQKRKLSVAVAFIGCSKTPGFNNEKKNNNVIILDEPTSGMDPYSRRFTWNLIKKKRNNNIIILTTHSMDEADILSNRIAILAHGKLQCLGSTLFLKKKFNVGYNLTLVLTDNGSNVNNNIKYIAENDNVNPTTDDIPNNSVLKNKKWIQLVKTYVTDMKVVLDTENEIIIRLPISCNNQLPKLFSNLDNIIMANKEKTNSRSINDTSLLSYGISVTTVEEIFLKVAQNEHENSINLLDQKVNDLLDFSSINQDDLDDNFKYNTKNKVKISDQLQALMIKRILCMKRDLKKVFSQFGWPLLTIFLLLLFISKLQDSAPSHTISTFNPAKEIIPLFNTNPENSKNNSIISTLVDRLYSILPLMKETIVDEKKIPRYLLDIANKSSITSTLNHPAAISFTSEPLNKIRSVLYYNETIPDSLLKVSQAFYLTLCKSDNMKTKECDVEFSIHPLPQEIELKNAIITFISFIMALTITLSLGSISSNFGSYIAKEKENGIKIIQYNNSSNNFKVFPFIYYLSNFLIDYICYSIITIIIILLLYLFHIDGLLKNGRSVAVFVVFQAYGFSIIPLMYFLSLLLFNSASSAQTYLSYFNLLQLLFMSISYIFSYIPMLCETNNKFIPYFRLFPGFSMGYSLLQLTMIENAWWRKTCRNLNLNNLNEQNDNNNSNLIMDLLNQGNMKPYTPFSNDITGLNIMFMVLSGILYIILLITIDYAKSYPAFMYYHVLPKKLLDFINSKIDQFDSNIRDFTINRTNIIEDDDIINEKIRILTISHDNQRDALKVMRLRKVYLNRGFSFIRSLYSKMNNLNHTNRNKIAVKDLSFGVQPGQIFGFLGINGAGKSTTLNILNGSILPTSGTALIYENDILLNNSKAQERIGFCPQYNSLIDHMTVYEHLILFARLRGLITKDSRYNDNEFNKKFIHNLIKKLHLQEFKNIYSKKLSGGNKRKLMVAITLLNSNYSHSSLLFLDEPSTGVDAVAKRFLWNILSQTINTSISKSKIQIKENNNNNNNNSIILTTHSMEEAQAVCTLAGIMVDGSLKCFGTIQHLKNKFGKGYLTEFKIKTSHMITNNNKNNNKENYTNMKDDRKKELFRLISNEILPCNNIQIHSLQGDALQQELQLILLKQYDIEKICFIFGKSNRFKDIHSNGSGWFLYSCLQENNYIHLNDFFEWWILQDITNRLTDFLLEKFQYIRFIEQHGNYLRYELQILNNNNNNNKIYSLGEIFTIIENSKEDLFIEEYSVSQPTLEQIFNQFASQQEHEHISGPIEIVNDVNISQ